MIVTRLPNRRIALGQFQPDVAAAYCITIEEMLGNYIQLKRLNVGGSG